MRTSEIEKQLRNRPFVPFRLCMSDGNSFDVRHPEMILVSRTIIAVALHEGRAGRPESPVFCDPVHIIRTEPMSEFAGRASDPALRPIEGFTKAYTRT